MRSRTPLAVLDATDRARAGVASRAGWREPMLATLTDERFSREGWLFERKLDGVRVIASRAGGEPTLWSRNQKSMNANYPELVTALADRAGPDLVADGEIVAFEGNQTSFARLQSRIHLTGEARIRATGAAVYLYLFDLLQAGDADLRRIPLRSRKKVLRRAVEFGDPLRQSQHRLTDGTGLYQLACRRGWEGVVAKRAGSRYQSGRSRDWLKFPCTSGQELVIGGFTEPQGVRTGFGALLVGHYEGRRLRYAGKVGTGYSQRVLRDLRERLDGLERSRSPFADEVREPGVHWVRPELVAEIGFSEWTTDGRLRHPRYRGLRADKPADEVVREER